MIPNPFRKFDLDKMRRSSDQLNRTMDFARVVSKRLMVFAVVICVLFGAVDLNFFYPLLAITVPLALAVYACSKGLRRM